ncbi:MAG: Peptidyl-prolyl cis-trans isomerase, partial [Bacteroidetes bacterium]|nr:Peptidyl-prolyl cis-trans isomerase [Bacteroidota bacterium]
HELQDRFFVKLDSTQKNNLLYYAISKVTEGDSICVLIPAKQLFQQQFKSGVPAFCERDSVIKINLKIKKIFSLHEFQNLTKTVQNKEREEIEAFFKSPQAFQDAKDSMGFYWVERPYPAGTIAPIDDDIITLSYSGSFLNGRVIDVSREGFQFKYGTPDQLLKGLNYVIGKLKKGQTSKIILPSQLAFGENGSSNGSVPPFTPMLYKISLIDIKTKEVD